ncbi:tRNA(Ser) (uridine(44)-2'-O)-methyltransferase [Malassezia psittaci]|uniref:tRNA (uracil-O(2)-)-methyltransferase n=1 Tax=Malassezia psittaci TaxID=1821823 RepID=A0AAF0F415_9BASI|nr:tRNA(Ser) (uridine(44)-2'-O)-methyltransferase [Malassezia psittaci]
MDDGDWIRMLKAPAPYAMKDWLATMLEWIRYPERNSTGIRRCEVWAEDQTVESEGMKYRCVRRLLPRRTLIDRGMLQECEVTTNGENGTLMYTTLRLSDQEDEQPSEAILNSRSYLDYPTSMKEVPYYHPAVRCLAIHYWTEPNGNAEICVDFVPFSDGATVEHLSESSRLGRTALSLLRLAHQHSCGHAESYVKRVVHDVLVPRDAYQDLYIELRTRYARNLIETWREVTDPKKHVFEDLGIAAYLMLLWKEMFPAPVSIDSHNGKNWGQPSGGFVDIGCGNGLLVHILHQEGYAGYGLDLRERKSWLIYRQQGARLESTSIDAPAIVRGDIQLPANSFLIGNHADELTPWLPILASCTHQCAGFLNIPCCAWTLEGNRFTPSQTRLNDEEIAKMLLAFPRLLPPMQPPSSPHTIPNDPGKLLQYTLWFAKRVIRPASENGHSKHMAYYAYITRLHMCAGWCFETEALRIPSTKNWALIGRCKVDVVLDSGSQTRLQQWSDLKAHAARQRVITEPLGDSHD